MGLSGLANLVLILLCAFTVYRYVIYPVLLSPLCRIPLAHPTACLAPLWILWIRYVGRENVTVHAAHIRLGPLVRLGPSEISVNCVDGGIRTIYGAGYEKGDWYSLFDNYGVPNMFSTAERGPHSARRRQLSNVYAKSTLQTSPALARMTEVLLFHRMLPRIAAAPNKMLEAYELFSATTMDFVTGYIFGLPQASNFLQDLEGSRKWLHNYKARSGHTFWPQELPNLTAAFTSFGIRRLLLPKWVDRANADINEWCLSMCDAAESAMLAGTIVDPDDQPVVYGMMRTMMRKQTSTASAALTKSAASLSQMERLELASEMLDHLAAGFDTSGITLTYLAWEVSKPCNRRLQKSLQEEVRALRPNFRQANTKSEKTGLPDPKELDALPLLHAILMETLRLHAAIPGGQPRKTPLGAVLGTSEATVTNIPAGIRVSSQAYSLHRNPDVFPKPEEWTPERWLDAEGMADCGGEKARWHWPFSSGGRMCVGSNFAMLEMKNIVAAIWSNYTTSIVDDKGMQHNDGYTAAPMGSAEGNHLLLQFANLV